MSLRVAWIAVNAIVCSQLLLLTTGAAIGADLPAPTPVPPIHKAAPVPEAPSAPFSRFYLGAAVTWVHHTGYVPASPVSMERYTTGGKAFGGYRVNEWVHLEAAYHYLGRVEFPEGLPTPSQERSYAVASSVVLVSPALSRWIGWTFVPVHAFLRFGLAYKDITHESAVGTFNEGVLSGVFGGGLEYRLTPQVFARIEYEFLSSAIGGPNQRVPTLQLFDATFGGTRRAINAMHTPLAVSLGMYL